MSWLQEKDGVVYGVYVLRQMVRSGKQVATRVAACFPGGRLGSSKVFALMSGELVRKDCLVPESSEYW